MPEPQAPVTPPAGAEPQKAEPTFTQADLDRIVQERLSRDRAKFADYEDLRRKAADYEKQQEQLKQMDLEKKQEYDKAKQVWEQKENEYKTMLDKTRGEIQQERITNALSHAVLKTNAYPEAADLLKGLARYNDDGTVTIKGKDSNGIDAELSVEKGVEQFLKDRPYLVKGGQSNGAGTASAGNAGGVNTQENLAAELQNAMAAGDVKRQRELSAKIRAKHAAAGIAQAY